MRLCLERVKHFVRHLYLKEVSQEENIRVQQICGTGAVFMITEMLLLVTSCPCLQFPHSGQQCLQDRAELHT